LSFVLITKLIYTSIAGLLPFRSTLSVGDMYFIFRAKVNEIDGNK